MKKEIRLKIDMTNENERLLFETASSRTSATAFIKDIVIDYLKGELIDKKMMKEIVASIPGVIVTAGLETPQQVTQEVTQDESIENMSITLNDDIDDI